MIWVYPSINSDESLILEWEGIKRTFAEIDEIDEDLFDREVESSLEHYLAMQQAKIDQNQTGFETEYGLWTKDILPRLIYLCWEQGSLPVKKPCFTNCGVNRNFAFGGAPTTRVIERETIRETILAGPSQGRAVRSYADLRALTGYADLDSVTVVGTDDPLLPPAVGGGGPFWFDVSSLSAEDGGLVIRPNDKTALQAGRWRRL